MLFLIKVSRNLLFGNYCTISKLFHISLLIYSLLSSNVKINIKINIQEDKDGPTKWDVHKQ